MPLTDPQDYEPAGGVNPKDENHPFFRKPAFPNFLRPITQKVFDKHLWPEVIVLLLILIIGVVEVSGKQVSSALFFMLGVFSTAVLYRFIHIEEETHQKFLPTPPVDPVDTKAT